MLGLQQEIKELLRVPDNYHILLMPGGAHQQFSAVMLNLCDPTKTSPPHYVDSGHWSRKAAGVADAHCRLWYPEWYQREERTSGRPCSELQIEMVGMESG